MIEQVMAIYAVADENEEQGFRTMLVPLDKKWWMNESDVCVGMTTVKYSAPDNMSREEMALKAVETLKDRQKQVMADAQVRFNKLQDRIEGLLMLTHDGASAKTEAKPAPKETYGNVVNGNFSGGLYDGVPF